MVSTVICRPVAADPEARKNVRVLLQRLGHFRWRSQEMAQRVQRRRGPGNVAVRQRMRRLPACRSTAGVRRQDRWRCGERRGRTAGQPVRGPGTDAGAQRQRGGDTRDQGQRRQRPIRPVQRAQVRDGPVADTKTPGASRWTRRPTGAGQVDVVDIFGPVLTASRPNLRRI